MDYLKSTDVEVAAYILAEHNADLGNVVDSSAYEPMYYKEKEAGAVLAGGYFRDLYPDKYGRQIYLQKRW